MQKKSVENNAAEENFSESAQHLTFLCFRRPKE